MRKQGVQERCLNRPKGVAGRARERKSAKSSIFCSKIDSIERDVDSTCTDRARWQQVAEQKGYASSSGSEVEDRKRAGRTEELCETDGPMLCLWAWDEDRGSKFN